jgi:hypothetical protein
MTGDADSASSILELLNFMLTGYRSMSFASYGLRMSRIASKSVTSGSSQRSYLSGVTITQIYIPREVLFRPDTPLSFGPFRMWLQTKLLGTDGFMWVFTRFLRGECRPCNKQESFPIGRGGRLPRASWM